MKFFKIRQLLTVPSLLNICGIAIAIAAFYVLVAIADFELTFNKSITKHENIYQVCYSMDGGQLTNNNMRPLLETMGREFPSVEKYGCFAAWFNYNMYVKQQDGYHQIEMMFGECSKGLLDVFGFQIVEGDTSKFINLRQMIISRQMAEKYGIKVGDYVRRDIQNTEEIEIVAIYETMKENTEIGSVGGFLCLGDRDLDNPHEWSYTYYLRYMDGAPKPEFNNATKEMFRNLIKNFFTDEEDVTEELLDNEINKFELSFVALDDLHLHSEIAGYHPHTDKNIVCTLVILAVFVILIAFINYFNFFMARVPQRLKTVNTRKVLGSSRDSLIMGIVGESVIFTLVAMALAAAILFGIMPRLLDSVVHMDTIVFSNVKALIITILTAIAAAVLTSLYPAMHITSVSPAMALKGQMTQGHDSIIRYFLIGLQVTASVVLIICSLFVNKNNDFIRTREIGFNQNNLLSTWTTQKIAENRETVRARLLQNPDIVDIAWTMQDLVAPSRMYWSVPDMEDSEKSLGYFVCPVSWNFLDFMGIKMAVGRGFTESDEQNENGVIIFNETARKKWEIDTESRVQGHHGRQCELAGFCNDFNFRPLQYGISPFAFYIYEKDSERTLRKLYIRTAEGVDVKKAINYVRTTLVSIDPDFDIMNPEIRTFEKEIAQQYQVEKQIATMVTLFTTIAIIISVMGIFGIVLLDTERRRKEIGIRKVNGATTMEILSMFNRKFLILTLVCSVIAIPLAYIITNKYFSGFTYHYDINAWLFIVGELMTLAISVLVVTGASYSAANENPVDTLKTE
ncbi:MAG: ABC transporter permease [Bacteroidales bacterium]|nr:ABC transporter permease [Bacteroidales bacterium]